MHNAPLVHPLVYERSAPSIRGSLGTSTIPPAIVNSAVLQRPRRSNAAFGALDEAYASDENARRDVRAL